jgi:hypothetical protein
MVSSRVNQQVCVIDKQILTDVADLIQSIRVHHDGVFIHPEDQADSALYHRRVLRFHFATSHFQVFAMNDEIRILSSLSVWPFQSAWAPLLLRRSRRGFGLPSGRCFALGFRPPAAWLARVRSKKYLINHYCILRKMEQIPKTFPVGTADRPWQCTKGSHQCSFQTRKFQYLTMGRQVCFYAIPEDQEALMLAAEGMGLLAIPAFVRSGQPIPDPVLPSRFQHREEDWSFFFLVPSPCFPDAIRYVEMNAGSPGWRLAGELSPVIEFSPSCASESVVNSGRMYLECGRNVQGYETVSRLFHRLERIVKRWPSTEHPLFRVGFETAKQCQNRGLRLVHDGVTEHRLQSVQGTSNDT